MLVLKSGIRVGIEDVGNEEWNRLVAPQNIIMLQETKKQITQTT